MKQANNNEVDLLLRSFASGHDARALQGDSMSAGERRALSNHLDADELNSYAEGVLPTPARLRYTEHLADCQQCRRIVIGLTQATGATAYYEAPEQQRGAGFWQKLTAWLSPAVLRYAVSALALAGLIGISMFVFLQRGGRDYLAKYEQREHTPTSAEQLKPTEPAAGTLAPATRPEAAKTFQLDPNAPLDQAKQNAQGEKSPVEVLDGYTELEPQRKLKDLKSTGQESSDAESQPSNAPEPKAAAPPSPATSTLSSADKSAGIGKEQAAKREDRDEAERNQNLYKNTPSDEHGPNRAAPPRSAGAVNSLRVGEPNNERTGSGTDKQDRPRETESITTVAGRHFKHEGNTWIDTTYQSSRGAINVTRGSEQYRALVADEPGLRTIAEQLRGVVIVVWKNRVYRIQ